MRPQSIGIFFILLLMFAAGCEDKIQPGTTHPASTAVVKAVIATAHLTNQPLIYEAVGTVAARTASTISSKIMGTVKTITVREGDPVKKGDILVILDQRQVAAQLRRAQAALAEAKSSEAAAVSALEAARAGAEAAGATFRRYQNLMQDESATPQEFDDVKARHRQAQAAQQRAAEMVQAARSRIREAEATLASAAVARRDAVVRAPYDGTVVAKLVETGDLAAPGTGLVTLQRAGGYRVNVVLPEDYFKAVRLKQAVTVRVPAARIESLEGTVETIVPAADQSSRSFVVKVSLPTAKSIRSGMFARVAMATGREKILLIPHSALVIQGQLTGVFILDRAGMARFRLVRTGRKFGAAVEVISGLAAGDRFVASPPPALVDGTRVEAVS